MSDAKIEKQYYSSSLYEGESYFVGKDGAFNYQKKIEIAHEDGAIFPELMLSYNSNHGNGMIGIGWKLDGIGFITRDLTYPLNYDGNDHYIGPNGDRLVKSTGNIYTYENEDYPRFELSGGYGGNGDEPLEWVKTDSSGGKYYYGTGDNSRAKALDSNGDAKGIRLWALQRVEDTTGNYYTIEYRHDGGEIYPDEILYKESNELSSEKNIYFIYNDELEIPETRGDKFISYKYKTRVETNLRLEEIYISSGSLSKKYLFDYDEDIYCYKSKLNKIAISNDNGSELNSISISWESYTPGWENHSTYVLPDAINDYNHFDGSKSLEKGELIDINGDCLVDFVVAYKNSSGLAVNKVYLNTGSGWQESVEYRMMDLINDYYSMGGGRLLKKGQFADINGDGLIDRVSAYKSLNGSDVKHTFLNTGSGWHQNSAYALPDVIKDYHYFGGDKPLEKGELVDINGDCLVDFVVAYKNSSGLAVNKVYLNTGSGWQESVEYRMMDLINDYYSMGGGRLLKKGQFADINGDGLIDRVSAYRALNGSNIKHTFLNSGSGWQQSTAYTLPDVIKDYYHFGGDRPLEKGQLIDINGDNLVDWVMSYTADNGLSFSKVFLNRGDGWEDNGNYRLPDIVNDYYKIDNGKLLIKGILKDLNGDGLVDLVSSYKNDSSDSYSYTHINTGYGWVRQEDYAFPETINDYSQLVNDILLIKGQFIDINGDGLLDWAAAFKTRSGSNYRYLYLNNSKRFSSNSVSGINIGQVNIEYTSTFQAPGAINPLNSVYPDIINRENSKLVKNITSVGSHRMNYTYTESKVHMGMPWERYSSGFSEIVETREDD